MSKNYLLLVCTTLILLAFALHHHMPAILHWVHALGFIAPLFFVLLYCLSTLLFLPTTPLILAGGALFGPIFGTSLSLFSATISAICAFLLSRYVGLDWLSSQKKIKLQQFTTKIENHGWKSVALCRLAPIIPCSLINYGFGLTRINFYHYLTATFIFLIPYKIILTYCGYASTLS